jgi:phenylpyruvate tautomerase PptA (4-oxalocrotonate tautomerase family)
MPFLAIATNAEISAKTEGMLLKEASKAVASGTGKPEQYVLVRINAGQPLLFAGTNGPAAFLEVKSIGFPANGVKNLASALCELVMKHLGVPGDRTYIVFEDVKASMWGHDGKTFG